MALLAQMCPHKEALDWLVTTVVNRIGVWKGPAELRGILCWKFKPADGVEFDSSLPGFTLADGERLSIEQHDEIRAAERTPEVRQRLSAYLIEAKTGRIQ